LFIPDPDPDFLPIPDPGIKKATDPGSATLIFTHHTLVVAGNSLADFSKATKSDNSDPDDADILSRNLGLDIIVVVTKTDTMTQLGTTDLKIFFSIIFNYIMIMSGQIRSA
jgi:hypothetical protein